MRLDSALKKIVPGIYLAPKNLDTFWWNWTFITHGFRVSVVSDVRERVRDFRITFALMLRRSSLVECVSVLHGTCLQSVEFFFIRHYVQPCLSKNPKTRIKERQLDWMRLDSALKKIVPGIYLAPKNLDTFWWNCQIIFRCASFHGRVGFIFMRASPSSLWYNMCT
jgi:hypothetical protein